MKTLRSLANSITFRQVIDAIRTLYPDDSNRQEEYQLLYNELKSVKTSHDMYDNEIYISRLSTGELATGNIFQGALSDLVENRIDNRAQCCNEEILATFLHDYIVGHDNGSFNFKHELD